MVGEGRLLSRPFFRLFLLCPACLMKRSAGDNIKCSIVVARERLEEKK